MAKCRWMDVETNGNVLTVHFKRNIFLWWAFWRAIKQENRWAWYRYPQVLYLVTKAWWACG